MSAEIGLYELSYTIFLWCAFFRRAFSTLHVEQQMFPNWRKSDGEDERKKEKERVFGVVTGAWSHANFRAVESEYYSYFIRRGRKQKILSALRGCSRTSVSQFDRQWPKFSTESSLSFAIENAARVSLLEKFRWLHNSVYSRIGRDWAEQQRQEIVCENTIFITLNLMLEYISFCYKRKVIQL